MNINKKIIFNIFLICIPFLFFIFLEFLLRVFDIYSPIHLFTKKDNKFYQINFNIGERYFDKNKYPVPNIYPQTFLIQKPKDVFRIFCLGGSTTAGFL